MEISNVYGTEKNAMKGPTTDVQFGAIVWPDYLETVTFHLKAELPQTHVPRRTGSGKFAFRRVVCATSVRRVGFSGKKRRFIFKLGWFIGLLPTYLSQIRAATETIHSNIEGLIEASYNRIRRRTLKQTEINGSTPVRGK